jgi:hypothetical protein
MPWYDGPSTKAEEGTLSKYGLHWNDKGHNPTNANSSGQADIFASHYPLTGPYHGSSTALLEYQVSLMKVAGVDGVIFDWYGAVFGYGDYEANFKHTENMVNVLKRAGLKFAVCYEDRTLEYVGKTQANAIASFKYMKDNWFDDPSYIKIDGRPVVLNFGPFSGYGAEDWNAIFTGAGMSSDATKPIFVVLPHLAHLAPVDSTAYNWPAPLKDVTGKGTPTSRKQVDDYLDAFLVGFGATRYKVFTVFSGFADVYNGINSTGNRFYGEIDYENGEVWKSVWKKVMARDPHVVQIATWNDYGEGTIIEPTLDWGSRTTGRGYSELLEIQKWVKEKNPAFPHTPQDLRRPLEVYKRHYDGDGADATATAATNALFNNKNPSNTTSAEAYRTATNFIAPALGDGTDPKADLRPILRN